MVSKRPPLENLLSALEIHGVNTEIVDLAVLKKSAGCRRRVPSLVGAVLHLRVCINIAGPISCDVVGTGPEHRPMICARAFSIEVAIPGVGLVPAGVRRDKRIVRVLATFYKGSRLVLPRSQPRVPADKPVCNTLGLALVRVRRITRQLRELVDVDKRRQRISHWLPVDLSDRDSAACGGGQQRKGREA